MPFSKKTFIPLIFNNLHIIPWLFVCTLFAPGRKPEGNLSRNERSRDGNKSLYTNRNLNNAHPHYSAEIQIDDCPYHCNIIFKRLYNIISRFYEGVRMKLQLYEESNNHPLLGQANPNSAHRESGACTAFYRI